MSFFSEQNREAFERMICDLMLIYPFGIGYALSYNDVLDLPVQMAEKMLEYKYETMQAFAKSQ
jgi:hypothetical protein